VMAEHSRLQQVAAGRAVPTMPPAVLRTAAPATAPEAEPTPEPAQADKMALNS
jgi:hypothetical protein